MGSRSCTVLLKEKEDRNDDRFLLTRLMISNKAQICARMNRGAPQEEL